MSKERIPVNKELDAYLIQELEDLHKTRRTKFILTAYSILKNYEEAEDSVQEAFYLAYQSLHTFQKKSSLATWIYRILVNFCFKKNQNRVKELKNIELDEQTIVKLGDFRQNQVSQFEKNEMHSIISECFTKLDIKYRLPLILYHYNGFGIDSMSYILGIPPGTVKSRLHIARIKMGFLLEKAFGGREVLEDILGLF